MKIANNIIELIGMTPLVRLEKISKGLKSDIIAKLECFNPGGSIKDRVGYNMIIEAEKQKKIFPGKSIIIEPTSGNTGISLAIVCAVKGYELFITMPETMSKERKKIISALGATVVLTPSEDGMEGAVAEAERLHEDIKDSFILQQFNNPANPEIHEKTTAVEIWNDTEGKVGIIIGGIGTGGTLTGCSRFLKEKNERIKVIAVEPLDSPVLSGGKPGPHKIQGIGAGFIPPVLDVNLLDEIIKVSTSNAYEMSRRLAEEEGILSGISSGAVLWAATKIAKRDENKRKMIVVILPDTGERYLSTDLFGAG